MMLRKLAICLTSFVILARVGTLYAGELEDAKCLACLAGFYRRLHIGASAGEDHARLLQVRFQLRHDLAFLDEGALGEEPPLDQAGNLGPNLRHIKSRDARRQFLHQRHIRRLDHDKANGLGRVLRTFPARIAVCRAASC